MSNMTWGFWFCVFVLLMLWAGAATMPWEPDANRVHEAWGRAQLCSQFHDSTGLPVPVAGLKVEDVKWEKVKPGSMGPGIIGLWTAPNRIQLDERYTDSTWLYVHELLHYAFQGPEGDGHPLIPFVYPCNAMPWQHDGSANALYSRPRGAS